MLGYIVTESYLCKCKISDSLLVKTSNQLKKYSYSFGIPSTQSSQEKIDHPTKAKKLT
jgi:hypothetical protein